MAFSTNLRGLRSVAMAVLVSGASYAKNTNVQEVAERTVPGKLKNITGNQAGLNKPNKNLLPKG